MARASWPNYASRALCLAFGVWVTMGLTQGLAPSVQWTPKPRPVKVAVRAATAQPVPAAKAVAAPAPATAKPRQILPLRVEDAPAPKPAEPPKPAPEMAAAAPLAPVPEIVQEMPAPSLEQPALDLASNVPVLPPVPGSQVPEAPGNTPVQLNNYPEQPGGPVLVLELTVNDQGVVEDSRILVPSYNTLGDLSLALASRGQRWTGLTPPLQPGERRKLEIRIPYGEDGVVAPPQATLP